MLTVILAAALILLAASAACGGDDDSGGNGETPAAETPAGDEETPESDAGASLDEYFTALEGIAAEREAELTDNVDDHNSQDFFGDPEGEYAALQVLLTRTGAAYELSAIQVANLDVPADLEDEHLALVTATGGRASIVSNLLADVVDAGNMSDANDVIDTYSPDIDEVDATLIDACVALQDIADENEIDVDLLCSND